MGKLNESHLVPEVKAATAKKPGVNIDEIKIAMILYLLAKHPICIHSPTPLRDQKVFTHDVT